MLHFNFVDCLFGLGLIIVCVMVLPSILEFFGSLHPANPFAGYENIGKPFVVEPKSRRGATIVYRKMTVTDDFKFLSPDMGTEWKNFQLEADEVPTLENENGIYGFHNSSDVHFSPNSNDILVEVELRGQRVQHEIGSRGQFGRITNILDVGKGVMFSDGSNAREYYKKKGLI